MQQYELKMNYGYKFEDSDVDKYYLASLKGRDNILRSDISGCYTRDSCQSPRCFRYPLRFTTNKRGRPVEVRTDDGLFGKSRAQLSLAKLSAQITDGAIAKRSLSIAKNKKGLKMIFGKTHQRGLLCSYLYYTLAFVN